MQTKPDPELLKTLGKELTLKDGSYAKSTTRNRSTSGKAERSADSTTILVDAFIYGGHVYVECLNSKFVPHKLEIAIQQELGSDYFLALNLSSRRLMLFNKVMESTKVIIPLPQYVLLRK